MTIGFFYLAVLLLGAILALVTGLIRRIMHPSELCDGVVVPSHEHWAWSTTPLTDLVVLFITFFGAVGLFLHGVTTMSLGMQVPVAVAAGAVGALVLRRFLCSWPGPSTEGAQERGTPARVVRTIPPGGFGQVEMTIGDRTVKLAARSSADEPIEAGSEVLVADSRDSVVVVSPTES